MTQSEVGLVAVPAAADSFTSVNVFTVPAGVKRLKKLRLSCVPDLTLASVSVRVAPIFRLIGSGMLEQSPHQFVGMFGGVFGLTDGGYSSNEWTMEYEVEIPVTTGGNIDVQVNTLDEAITAGSVTANLFYDNIEPQASNSMADTVDAAGTTTATAFATVGTFTVPKSTAGNDPKRIKAVIIGIAVDQGIAAFSLRLSSRIRLSGSGLAEGGQHDIAGPSGDYGIVVIGGQFAWLCTKKIMNDIPVNPGGPILVEHQFDVETPTASTVCVGILYE